jgi:hypothetical protein
MSRQGEQDARWLSGYRLVAAILVLLAIIATLVGGYQRHREQALATSLTLLGEQFAERVQRLHGRWLDERRPARLHAEGQIWQFDERGWPLGMAPLVSPSADCQQLWQGAMGSLQPGNLALQFRGMTGGCLMGIESHWLYYRFADGRVLPWRMPQDGTERG